MSSIRTCAIWLPPCQLNQPARSMRSRSPHARHQHLIHLRARAAHQAVSEDGADRQLDAEPGMLLLGHAHVLRGADSYSVPPRTARTRFAWFLPSLFTVPLEKSTNHASAGSPTMELDDQQFD